MNLFYRVALRPLRHLCDYVLWTKEDFLFDWTKRSERMGKKHARTYRKDIKIFFCWIKDKLPKDMNYLNVQRKIDKWRKDRSTSLLDERYTLDNGLGRNLSRLCFLITVFYLNIWWGSIVFLPKPILKVYYLFSLFQQLLSKLCRYKPDFVPFSAFFKIQK